MTETDTGTGTASPEAGTAPPEAAASETPPPDAADPDAASGEGAPDDAPEDAPEDDRAREVAELKDRLLRAVAETENVRKRAARDRADAQRYAIADFARDVVGVADDLARALDNLPDTVREGDDAAALVEGLELTRRNLDSALERRGLVRIDPAGEPFDHNFHEAMFEAVRAFAGDTPQSDDITCLTLCRREKT